MSRLKKILGVILFVFLLLGTGSGVFLFQQNQDIRQQASTTPTCGSSTNPTSCNARPGCEWEVTPTKCSEKDCNTGTKKDGCDISKISTTCSELDLTTCRNVGCTILPAVTGSCGSLNSPGQCNATDHCHWGGDRRTCSLSNCDPNHCTYTAEQTTACTTSDCWRGDCTCTTTTTEGSCTGPSACSGRSEAYCRYGGGGCSWREPRTTTSVTGRYASTPESCSGSDYYVNNRCKTTPPFSSYTVSPPQCDPNDTYLRNGSCIGTYNIESCIGTPREYCSDQTTISCEEQGKTCTASYTGGSCTTRTAQVDTQCTQGSFECVSPTSSKYCKTDGTWSSAQTCATGQTCNYDTGKCEAPDTPDPDIYCTLQMETTCEEQGRTCIRTTTGGRCSTTQNSSAQCYFGISTCPTGKIASTQCSSSSCPTGSGICCQDSEIGGIDLPEDSCIYGNNYCDPNNENQVLVCQTDPNTGDKNYQAVACGSGKICPAGQRACEDTQTEEEELADAGGSSTCSQLGASCCFDERDYSLSCTNDLIPNSDNPSTCRCRAVATECEPGERSCDGTTTRQCSSAGTWVDLRTCANRCSEGACIENLSDGALCLNNADCTSNNCQSVPGSRICAPQGEAIGVVAAGETCGTTAYDRTCESGYVCSENMCKANNGTSCTINTDCASTYCSLVSGIRMCTATSQSSQPTNIIQLGGSCIPNSTTAICESGTYCESNTCTVDTRSASEICGEDALPIYDFNESGEYGLICEPLSEAYNPDEIDQYADYSAGDLLLDLSTPFIAPAAVAGGTVALPAISAGIETAAQILPLASALGQGTVTGTALSLPTATSTIIGNALASAPAWVPNAIALGGAASEIAGGVYYAQACGPNGDPVACANLQQYAVLGWEVNTATQFWGNINNSPIKESEFIFVQSPYGMSMGGGVTNNGVYLDELNGVVTKFPTGINSQSEMLFMEEFGGTLNIPEFLGYVENRTGYQMAIQSGVPIRHFYGKLTQAEIDQAVESLSAIHQLGRIHGDLGAPSMIHGDNILVNTLPDGSNVVKFIDFSGVIPENPINMEVERIIFQENLELMFLGKEPTLNLIESFKMLGLPVD